MIYELLKDKGAQFFVMFGSSKDPNFYYATGMKLPDPALYVIGEDGTELLVVHEMERRRAEKESRVKEMASLTDLGFYEKAKEMGVDDALAETFVELLKIHGARKILVPKEFPSFLLVRFQKSLEVEVVQNPFQRIRAVKKPKEVREIKKASEVAVKSFEFFLRLLEKERNCNVLRSKVELFVYENGCLAEDTIISSGVRSADPHHIGDGVVERHVIFDVFPRVRSSGYYSDFTRTVLVEKDEELEDMVRACIEAKNEAIKLVKPGVKAKELHDKVCDVLESYGYATIRSKAKEGFIHSTGHGVGLEVHEEPRIFNSEEELKPGMVFTIEPGLYYENVGGVRVEDTVLVKKSGCEVLTKYQDFVKRW